MRSLKCLQRSTPRVKVHQAARQCYARLAQRRVLGTYNNDYFGDIQIIERDGGLAIVEGPQKMTFALTHFDRDIFSYVTEGESASGISGVTFVLGPDGRATSVHVENLDAAGNGIHP